MMAQSQQWQWIPKHLTLEQFEEFVWSHLHIGSRSPQPKPLFVRDYRSRRECRHSQRSTDSVQDKFLHHTAPAVVPGRELT